MVKLVAVVYYIYIYKTVLHTLFVNISGFKI